MDFSLTDEQELLLASLAEVVERYGQEDYLKECDENDLTPQRLREGLHEAGFDMLGVPEEYGGTPCDTVTLILYHEELARLCSAGYACDSTSVSMADMIKFGSEKQLQDCVDSISNLRTPFALGFTEPNAGSDSGAIQTTYTRKNGKVIINGQKTFISRADLADHMLCMAKSADAPEGKNVFTTWWVPMNAKGVSYAPIKKVGWHSIHSCDVWLEDVELDETDMVGEEGKGFVNVMKNFEIERLVMAATALGEAELAFGDAVQYANERVQFHKTLGEFQLIQEKLTDMAAKIEAMKGLVYKGAWMEDQGLPINTIAALAKRYCATVSFEVIDQAMQIFGGLGYSADLRIGRVWRNNRLNSIGGGTNEIMVHVASRQILKDYKNGQPLFGRV